MRLGTSTTMGFNRPHGVKADIPDVVRILAEAGFKVQDMNFHDCSNFPTPLLTDKWESWVDVDDYRAVYARIGCTGRQVGFYSCSDGSRASDAGRLAER